MGGTTSEGNGERNKNIKELLSEIRKRLYLDTGATLCFFLPFISKDWELDECTHDPYATEDVSCATLGGVELEILSDLEQGMHFK